MDSASPPLPEPRLQESGPQRPLSRRGIERLDLMLLCAEALDLNGGEAMVWLSEEMGYTDVLPNRVELWKRRCSNPLRRTTRRACSVAARLPMAGPVGSLNASVAAAIGSRAQEFASS